MRFARYIFTFILFCSLKTANSQSVQNAAFNLVLKGLLSHTVKEVGVAEVKNDSTLVFLDARSKPEYDVSHIQNAFWVGYDDFDFERVGDLNKETKITVYCSVGYRSEKIGEKLKQAGYTNISNLYGGIFEWKNQNRPVYNSAGETNQVHAYDKTWGVWLNKGEKVYD